VWEGKHTRKLLNGLLEQPKLGEHVSVAARGPPNVHLCLDLGLTAQAAYKRADERLMGLIFHEEVDVGDASHR
jgi:hypothetical protein